MSGPGLCFSVGVTEGHPTLVGPGLLLQLSLPFPLTAGPQSAPDPSHWTSPIHPTFTLDEPVQPRAVLYNTVATSHVWLLSTGNVTNAAVELNFKFYSILINLHVSFKFDNVIIGKHLCVEQLEYVNPLFRVQIL